MTLQKRKSKSSRSSRKPRRKHGSTSKGRRPAVTEEIVITRHGHPAGVLIGFASEDDWFDYRLEHHPEFVRRIEDARVALREGRGTPLRDIR